MSESEHLNAINLAENHTDPAALGMSQAVLNILSEAVLGLSQAGDLQWMRVLLLLSGWGFSPFQSCGSCTSSSVEGDGGVLGPRVTPAISNAALCPDLVFQGRHALERVVAEMSASGNFWRETSWYFGLLSCSGV